MIDPLLQHPGEWEALAEKGLCFVTEQKASGKKSITEAAWTASCFPAPPSRKQPAYSTDAAAEQASDHASCGACALRPGGRRVHRGLLHAVLTLGH